MAINLPPSWRVCSTTYGYLQTPWLRIKITWTHLEWRLGINILASLLLRICINCIVLHLKCYMQKPKIDMSATILTSTFWPMSASTSPKWSMPSEISPACQSFEKFYYGRHNGRRLTWQPNMVGEREAHL